ncbi:protein RCC2 [Arctopsyche grandis]|uniref:protein RCC2 n=1 Tax=Arctopsyche grandis TaxID=121162 RepID=UPI00406D7941
MSDVGNGKGVKRPSSGGTPVSKKNDFGSSDESIDSDGSNDCSTLEDKEIDTNDIAEPLIKLPEEVCKRYTTDSSVLMIAGHVSWELTGKRETKTLIKTHPNLNVFHRFTDQKYRLVVSGCTSAHSVVVNEEGKAMTFGRNNCGQLGQDDIVTKDVPTEVAGLKEMTIIFASTGRNHTLFLTDSGVVYACGDNRNGQCGIGTIQIKQLTTPTKIRYRGPPIVKVACGGDFSMILDAEGGLHSFGLPENGQLGHNTDGKYLVTSNRLSYNFETSPKRIIAYIEKSKDGHVTTVDDVQITDVACGINHTVALDSKKRAFSWGFGGFGRLGHAEQKDELVPRLIKYFDSQSRGVRSIYCGASYSLAINDLGALFLFGQTKRTGEANMYPKPVQDLAGWNIRCVGTGNTSVVIAADDNLIVWGASPTYGELGLGDLTKSSTKPVEVPRMEGTKISLVSMGYSHTLLLCNDSSETAKEKLAKMPTFKP